MKEVSVVRRCVMMFLAIFIPIIIVLFTGEFVLRVVVSNTDYIVKAAYEFDRKHYFLGRAAVPNSQYDTASVSISINSHGFREREFNRKKEPGSYRIFALGGWSTFGHVRSISGDNKTYPAQLQKLLTQKKIDENIEQYEVINAGYPGYSVRTSLQNFASKILFYQPNAVIICHNTNDLARYGVPFHVEKPLHSLFEEKNFWVDLFELTFGWSYLMQEIRYSLLYRLNFFANASSNLAESGEWKVESIYTDVFKRDLENLVTLAKANNVIPILVSQSIAITDSTDFQNPSKEEVKMGLNRPDP